MIYIVDSSLFLCLLLLFRVIELCHLCGYKLVIAHESVCLITYLNVILADYIVVCSSFHGVNAY